MAHIEVPLKVQLGCDDCYRFLLAKTAELARYRKALETIEAGHAFGPREVARAALRGPSPRNQDTKEDPS